MSDRLVPTQQRLVRAQQCVSPKVATLSGGVSGVVSIASASQSAAAFIVARGVRENHKEANSNGWAINLFATSARRCPPFSKHSRSALLFTTRSGGLIGLRQDQIEGWRRDAEEARSRGRESRRIWESKGERRDGEYTKCMHTFMYIYVHWQVSYLFWCTTSKLHTSDTQVIMKSDYIGANLALWLEREQKRGAEKKWRARRVAIYTSVLVGVWSNNERATVLLAWILHSRRQKSWEERRARKVRQVCVSEAFLKALCPLRSALLESKKRRRRESLAGEKCALICICLL